MTRTNPPIVSPGRVIAPEFPGVARGGPNSTARRKGPPVTATATNTTNQETLDDAPVPYWLNYYQGRNATLMAHAGLDDGAE